MDLHSRLDRSELMDEERFDFLKGLSKLVVRMDEVHTDKMNDSLYVYLIWVKPDDTQKMLAGLTANISDLDDEWHFFIHNREDGFIVLYASF
jgi:hypothetical protein